MTANNVEKKLKIAVTGGIGSGKSLAMNVISSLGYPTFSADSIYADIISREENVIACSKLVGIDVLYVDNKAVFDRKAAAKKVFDDEVLRNKLNEYTHKLVYEEIENIFKKQIKTTFFEIPLLFESNRQNDFDKVLIILRDTGERIESVRKRDNKDVDLIEKIISSQFDYDNMPATVHTIIRNDKDISSFIERVKEVVESIVV